MNPEGTMHVTCSTATGSVYQASSPNENLVFQGQPQKPMALRIDVTDTELHLRAYVMDSWSLYDEYTTQKTRQAANSLLSYPQLMEKNVRFRAS